MILQKLCISAKAKEGRCNFRFNSDQMVLKEEAAFYIIQLSRPCLLFFIYFTQCSGLLHLNKCCLSFILSEINFI